MNACQEYKMWLGFAGLGAIFSFINFATGNPILGGVCAVAAFVGTAKSMELYEQCQALQARN
jgi:hypothetical protein